MQNINIVFKKPVLSLLIGMGLISGQAWSTQINFTGGEVTLTNGNTHVPNNSDIFQNVSKYIESGFLFEVFFASIPSSFSSVLGDYYSVNNDIMHLQWDEGVFGQVAELKVSKVDGSNFDLGGFQVAANTAVGGGPSSGGESVSINTNKADSIFSIGSDDWGLGSGPDPLITIDPTNLFFNDISWLSFTNDLGSTSVGFGLDDFFFDEAGDPNGIDPTRGVNVPVPATAALLIWGLALLIRQKG